MAHVTRPTTQYTGVQFNLYLETADRRLFADPYGPHHPGAVGRVFRLQKGPMREWEEFDVSFVRAIFPNMFDSVVGAEVPIRVYGEAETGNERTLLARIEYGPNERLIDSGHHNGVWLLLILFPQ